MLFLALVAAIAPPSSPLPRQWASLSRAGALSRVSETIDIATGDAQRSPVFRYRLRLTVARPNGTVAISWIDSAACPAVRPVIAGMRDIPMPRPAPYGVGDEQRFIVLDGASYSLTTPSNDPSGTLTITSNIGSSLAKWVDASFAALAPCWRAEP